MTATEGNNDLDDVLDRYEQRKAKEIEKDEERRRRVKQFQEDCRPILKDVVLPVVKNVTQSLDERGHDASFTDETGNAAISASVVFTFRPKNPAGEQPTLSKSLTFKCSWLDKALVARGNVSAPDGTQKRKIEHQVEDPTTIEEEWVRTQLTEFIEAVLARI